MMMTKTFLLALMALFASTSAFVQNDVSSHFGVATASRPTKDTTLSMALEGRSPQLRKNVMSATVSVFAMPTIAGALSTLATTTVPAALATQGTTTYLLPNQEWSRDPVVLGGLFLAHWFVTNLVLQKFKDVGEA